MQSLPNPAIQSDSIRIVTSEEARTPKEVGQSLFQDLLKRLNDESTQAEGPGGFFQDVPSDHKLGGNMAQRTDSETGEKFFQALEKLGGNRGQLKLRETSLPALVSFLRQKNISQEKIAQLLESSKDKNGSINLNSLFNKIFCGKAGSGKQKEGLVIDPADIPRLEAFLFQCGLKVEEVRKIIEKSVNPKGELVLANLSLQLSQYLKGDHSESRLLSVLDRLDIQPKSAPLETEAMESKWASLLKQIPEASSSQIQKRIKQELAALLRDKGLPPQEVKSFLETLSFQEIKVKTPGPQVSSTPLLDGVFIANGRDWQSSPWKERILRILQGDQYQTSKAAFKNGANDREIQLNLGELLKNDNAFKNEHWPYLSQGKPPSGQKEKEQILKDILERIKPQTKTQESTGAEINLKKPEIDLTRIETSVPVKPERNPNLPLPRIMERMLFMVRGGIQKSRLTIHPPELGRLDLDLSIKQGHLQAHLSAENPVVKEIIEANLNHLKQQLSDQGFVVEKFQVTLGLNDQKSAENQNNMSEGKRFSRSPKGPRMPRVSVVPNKAKQDSLIFGPYQVDVRA